MKSHGRLRLEKKGEKNNMKERKKGERKIDVDDVFYLYNPKNWCGVTQSRMKMT